MHIDDFNSLLQLDRYIRPKQRVIPKNNDSEIITQLKQDVFEKSQKQTEPFEIKFNHICPKTKTPKKIKAVLNPLDKGTIYIKVLNKNTGDIEKRPMTVDIAKTEEDSSVSYYFLTPKTHDEIGFVVIDDWKKARFNYLFDYDVLENTRLLDNFPQQGILGDRISIYYLQNNDETKYSGIGKLADQIAVEYCLQEGIEPNILSIADSNSHVAHYKRGRKFIPVDKYDKDLDYYDFVKKYGTNDPNKIIEERIANTPEGQKVDTSDLYGLYMYMPQEVIKKYLEIIKEKPVLHQIHSMKEK